MIFLLPPLVSLELKNGDSDDDDDDMIIANISDQLKMRDDTILTAHRAQKSLSC